MNEIIAQLECAKDKAEPKLVAVKAFSICSIELDYRAVFEMAYDHLTDTIHLFRHAQKLKQELEASRNPRTGVLDTEFIRHAKLSGAIPIRLQGEDDASQ